MSALDDDVEVIADEVMMEEELDEVGVSAVQAAPKKANGNKSKIIFFILLELIV